MTESNPTKWSKKRMIFVGLILVFILLLLLVWYVAYQYFVLGKSLEVQLLILSSQKARNILLIALGSILVIIAGVFGYFKLKNFQIPPIQKKRIFLRALIFILIIASLAGGYFSYQYYLVKKEFGPQLATQQETKRVVSAVAKLMLLPDETPTIATITDINKLKGQDFFSKAKNGDKILIYTNAKEAILYSPSTNKILGVAPVTIGGGGQAPSQATQARIGLRNGTTSTGITYKVEAQIQQLFPGATVTLKDNSSNKYAKTIVVVLNNAAASAAQDLANKLNATVSNLPSGESAPAGIDLLVIVGSDKI